LKAAIYRGPGRVELTDLPKPGIRDDELLIRVRAASICGTDLRISQRGHFKIPAGQSRVLGHEVAGEVAAVGEFVRGYAVGDRVTIAPNLGCGVCVQCRAGAANMCADYDAFGITLDGGFEEYLHVPGFAIQRGNVFHIPPGVAFAEAAVVEPFSCCYRGQRQLKVGSEDVVLIMGAGPIGAFHLLLAKLARARKVIVSDRAPARLDAAREFGADVVVNVTSEDLAEVVMTETRGEGADVVITAVSNAAVQSQSVELLATNGRVNFFAGLSSGEKVQVDTNRVHYKGLTLTGTTGSSNGDYLASMRLVGERRVTLGPVVTASFAIERIHEAFSYAESAAGMKAVVAFDGPAD
jgi:threonine dehydrogenase-like Zn-dependent dehydrogenase